MNPQPLIATDDVPATRNWYQAILGLDGGHGGEDYEQLMFDGRMVMQIHRWEAHEHPYIGNPSLASRGNGVLLWFQTDDFDGVCKRVEAQKAKVLEGPKVNPNANHRELWLGDPNGYVVVVAGAQGDLG